MLTSAERQKRYRQHGKGDHSLCDPKRCDALRPAPTNTPPGLQEPAPTADEAIHAPVAPVQGFGPRGTALMADMADAKLEPLHRALLVEACRIADRLDRLDAMLEGREDWVRLQARNDDATEVTVIVDQLLSEARQQATALRGLVAELRAATPVAKRAPGRPASVPDVPSGAKGGNVADLVARAARRRTSAG
jgi:hypothetical protein